MGILGGKEGYLLGNHTSSNTCTPKIFTLIVKKNQICHWVSKCLVCHFPILNSRDSDDHKLPTRIHSASKIAAIKIKLLIKIILISILNLNSSLFELSQNQTIPFIQFAVCLMTWVHIYPFHNRAASCLHKRARTPTRPISCYHCGTRSAAEGNMWTWQWQQGAKSRLLSGIFFFLSLFGMKMLPSQQVEVLRVSTSKQTIRCSKKKLKMTNYKANSFFFYSSAVKGWRAIVTSLDRWLGQLSLWLR